MPHILYSQNLYLLCTQQPYYRFVGLIMLVNAINSHKLFPVNALTKMIFSFWKLPDYVMYVTIFPSSSHRLCHRGWSSFSCWIWFGSFKFQMNENATERRNIRNVYLWIIAFTVNIFYIIQLSMYPIQWNDCTLMASVRLQPMTILTMNDERNSFHTYLHIDELLSELKNWTIQFKLCINIPSLWCKYWNKDYYNWMYSPGSCCTSKQGK